MDEDPVRKVEDDIITRSVEVGKLLNKIIIPTLNLSENPDPYKVIYFIPGNLRKLYLES